MYEVTCTVCGNVKYYEHRFEFNSDSCYGLGGCASLASGLQQYKWITKGEYDARNRTSPTRQQP